MALACYCSCCHDRRSSFSSADSSQVSWRIWSQEVWLLRAYCAVVRLIGEAISKFLTFSFVAGGVFAGATTGALAGWASNRGIIRGAVFLAIAGASIALEFLDTLRTSWCSNCSCSCSLSSTRELLERLIRQRFTDEQLAEFLPKISSIRPSQVNPSSTHHREMNAVHDEVTSTGLSADSIKRLPFHVLSANVKAAQETCCTICLQEIAVGDIARSLPQCRHTFHLTCVDKWLIEHGSCPVCRQVV